MRDLRALGAAAPIRAAYELSKRSGFHSVLFQTRTAAGSISSRKLRLTAVEPSSPQARQRCLDDAEEIARAGVRVFGRRVHTGVHGRWNLDPLTGQTWPESVPWWKIDIRSDARMSDVKHVWEAGRHRDLVVLARASVIDPGGTWLDVLVRALTSWCDQCPPERGVHWYSSLELALRAVAWSQVLTLVRDRLPVNLVEQMEAQLLASGRHLAIELPYTVSSMRNNHMLGDALGFLVLAQLFPGRPSSRRWQAVGNRLFDTQLARHMRPDGSMIEDSLSYHRFVLEMLIVRVLMGDAPPKVEVALRGASKHLRKLGALEGELPQYGDWDEGRVLTSSGDPLDVAGSTALGLALTGCDVPEDWHSRFDELSWYLPREGGSPDRSVRGAATAAPTRSGTPGADVSGGIVRVSRGPWETWLKVGGGPSHGHADLTSIWIKHEDCWVVSDPGTGTYNGPLMVRTGLRTSAAHPVVRPEGRDQLEPHRAFRWMKTAQGHLAPSITVGPRVITLGWHDAYFHDMGIRVCRAVIVAPDYVGIVDNIDGHMSGFELTVPLHPDVAWDGDQIVTAKATLGTFGLEGVGPVRGQETPFAGWHSSTYGDLSPSTWLTYAATTDTHVWGFGDPGSFSQHETRISDLKFSFRWSAGGVVMIAEDQSDDRRYSIEVAR